MIPLPFWKTQTVGNDFVLLHEEDVAKQGLADAYPEIARQLSRRRFGVGSDGILVVRPTADGIAMRMFNPDGTEDVCGNGARCAALHAYRQGWVGRAFTVDHTARRIEAEILADGRVRSLSGAADFTPANVPLDRDMFGDELFLAPVAGVVGSAVTTGSTHFVALVGELPDDERFLRESPALEHHPFFPERTSVIWARPVEERLLAIRIWERGAGETLGCGTGAVAAAAVWFRKSGLGGQVVVRSKGGDTTVEMRSWDSPAYSTSEPEEPFSGVALVRMPALSRP